MVQTTYPVSSFANVSYPPPDQTLYQATSAAGQRLSITWPDGNPGDYAMNAAHPDRFKVCIIQQLSGGSPGTSSSAPSSSFSSANGFPWQWLRNGGAVAEAQMTSQGSGNTGITGKGFIHLPGGTAGYYESRSRPMSIKDVGFIIQHLRYNWRKFAATHASSYRLTHWAAVYGANSAFSLPWCGSAPSRACELGNFGPYLESTVPNLIISNAVFPFNYFLFANNEANTGGFFPAGETGGAGVDDTVAASISAAPQRYVAGLGSYQLLSDFREPCHPRVIAFGNTGPENLAFGEPHIENVRGFAAGVHDAEHILMLREALPPGTVEVRLSPGGAFTLTTALTAQVPVPATYYDGNLTSAASGHVAAVGNITILKNPKVGDLITVGDGTQSVILEFQSGGGVAAGHYSVTIAGTPGSTGQEATNMSRVLNVLASVTPVLNLSWTAGTPSTTSTDFTSTQTDSAANVMWFPTLIDPATPTITISCTGLAATGTITLSGQPSDADTATLTDGTNTVIFEFDSGGGVSGTNTAVTIGASKEATMTNWLAAITASKLKLYYTALNPTAASTSIFGAATSYVAWSKSGANITVTTPTNGGTASSQSIADEDSVTGAVISAAVKWAKANEPTWDYTLPAAGIRVASQVNATARCIVPPARDPGGHHNGRAGTWLTCQSGTADGDLVYGSTVRNCRKKLRRGESVWIRGGARIFAKSSPHGTQVAMYERRECLAKGDGP